MKTQIDCPLWLRFLSEVIPEEQKQNLLQEFIGLISQASPVHKCDQMLVLLGGGSNGKSIIMNVIDSLFREESSRVDLASLTSRNNEYSVDSIDGKAINLCFGIEGAAKPEFKKLMAGERAMCRKPYRRPRLTTKIPMFICEANNLPELPLSVMRRLVVLNFDTTIHAPDVLLLGALIEEKDAIIEWAAVGAERYISNGNVFSLS